MTVQAYVYCGDWIGECSRPGCGGAEFLHSLRRPDLPAGPANPRDVRKPLFACTACHQIDQVEWPEDGLMADIAGVLAQRPVPHTRNWYPRDHPTAVAHRIPHGQGVDDLRAENTEHGVAVSS